MEKIIESISKNTVRVIAIVFMVFLCAYSAKYTEYMAVDGMEKNAVAADSVFANLVAVGLVLLISILLKYADEKISEKTKSIICAVFTGVVAVWLILAGMYWVTSAERIPEGDQAFIYGGASYFLEGNYSFLDKGGYLGMYPHQIVLVALLEGLFKFVGPFNYLFYQKICVFFVAGIHLIGYLTVRKMSKGFGSAVIYNCMMASCLPLIFYTSWVYGDFPSIFFMLLAFFGLYAYSRDEKTGYLVVLVAGATLAVAFRKNSCIMLVALVIIAVIRLIVKRDLKLIAATVISVILPIVIYASVANIYERASGYESYSGIPSISWVALGMMESESGNGWYYDYAKPIYYENDCDPVAAAEVYKRDIKDRLLVFRTDRDYCIGFYKDKFLSQWNSPLYQSLYFAEKKAGGGMASTEGTFSYDISKRYFPAVLYLCNRLQFIVFCGFLIYLFTRIGKKTDICELLAVTVIVGGMLFSIIWEAKARYILPYYILMYPMAAVAFGEIMRSVGRKK